MHGYELVITNYKVVAYSLAKQISKGAASSAFYGTAYGEHQGKFDGFKLGDRNVQIDSTLHLMEPVNTKSV